MTLSMQDRFVHKCWDLQVCLSCVAGVTVMQYMWKVLFWVLWGLVNLTSRPSLQRQDKKEKEAVAVVTQAAFVLPPVEVYVIAPWICCD